MVIRDIIRRYSDEIEIYKGLVMQYWNQWDPHELADLMDKHIASLYRETLCEKDVESEREYALKMLSQHDECRYCDGRGCDRCLCVERI